MTLARTTTDPIIRIRPEKHQFHPSERIFYVLNSPTTPARYDLRTGIQTGEYASATNPIAGDTYGSQSKRHIINGTLSAYLGKLLLVGNGKSVGKGTYGWYNSRISAAAFTSVFNKARTQASTYRWTDSDANNDSTPGEVNLSFTGPHFTTTTGGNTNMANRSGVWHRQPACRAKPSSAARPEGASGTGPKRPRTFVANGKYTSAWKVRASHPTTARWPGCAPGTRSGLRRAKVR